MMACVVRQEGASHFDSARAKLDMNSLKSQTATASWICKEAQALLNSDKTLMTDIESCPLSTWSFIWTVTSFYIF